MKLVLQNLSVLFLEDSEKDIKIIYQKLSEDFDCPVHMDSAATESRFVSLISNNQYDIILADYTLPGYNAPAALAQAMLLCPDVPFICVSGRIGEDIAVEILKQGAADYVLKDRLDRLPFAIVRALESARKELDKKRADQQLKSTVEILETAQRISHVGGWEWDIVHDEYYWSEETYRIFGIDSKTIKPYRGILSTFMNQEDRKKFIESLQRAIESGEFYDVEYNIFKPDGEQRYIRVLGVIEFDAFGRATLVRGAVQDITERKLSEIAIQEINESNKLILESSSDGIAMFSRDGTILNINRKFTNKFCSTVKEAIGMKFEDFFPRDEVFERRFRFIREVVQTGKPAVFEDTRDGIWFSNRIYPVFRDDQVAAVTLFAANITDQKAAADEGKKRLDSDARLNVMTEFFTNVSHELKTPLSLILMQLDMMRMHADDPGKLQRLISDATLNSYRLTRLVNNLLDITKMDAGFLRLNLRNRDIVSILKNICESVSEYAHAKDISFIFTSNAGAKQMDLDGDKMERAILNILSNAIKHTPEGGKIVVDFKDRQDTIAISVKDTGEGIPEDKLGAVFDRFVQVNNALSTQADGCGIGLALVKSMVELHQGRVWVESELGRGSTFTIELPVSNLEVHKKQAIVEGFELNKRVKMELSDLYIKVDA